MSDDPFRKTIHIVLADGDPGDVALICRVLERSRIRNQVHVVERPEAVLRFLLREPPFEQAPRPKLIILDLDFPGGSGLDLLRTLNRNPALRSIPVLIMTRSDDDHMLGVAYDERARAVITKPTDAAEFEAVVERLEAFWLATAKLPAD